MSNDFLDILTPQGYLNEVMHRPNLEVVMNLFKIPRAFSVSGFGDWSVGQHCFCVAYLGLYWARGRGYDPERRNRLIVMGLTHDLHESSTGDILPGLKTGELRARLEEVQKEFLQGLGVAGEEELEPDLKALDMVAFLFEIRQTAVGNRAQRVRLAGFFRKQRDKLIRFCEAHAIPEMESFLAEMGIVEPDGE